MKILVVGSGGREHAIVRALARTWSSSEPLELLAAPGNPGIAADARCFAEVGAEHVPALVELAERERVDLVVVGPEVPLVDGIVDALQARSIKAFGPARDAARLEGSKIFCKEVLLAAGVPTAAHIVLRSHAEALHAAESASYPTVFKSDGLAAGKGVIICADEAEARAAIDQYFTEQRFGETDVILEDHLDGVEVSLLAICDGERAYSLVPARDYKRIFDNDEGPNTGGMGAFSPVPEVLPEQIAEISAQVHQPIVDELKRRGTPYHGILYAGLMLTADGVKVLEYNVRFGDPETQALLPRPQSDLAQLMLAACEPGGLADAAIEFSDEHSVTLTLASAGYPESSSKGDVIEGLEGVAPGIEVTHAGTALDAEGRTVTAGGRVLNVTALAASTGAAREAAYAAAEGITFTGRQLRRDIAAGQDQVPPEREQLSEATMQARRRVFRQTRDVRSVRSHPLSPRFAGDETESSIEHESESAVLTPAPETELEPIKIFDGPLVGIVMGAESDRAVMAAAADELRSRNINFEETVISAHRDPELVRQYAQGARQRGIKVIIAGAGMAAALPGVIAAQTTLPVIGVPIRSENAVSGGLDALLSIAQAPSGVPVACVAVNGAQNAAILAARILFS